MRKSALFFLVLSGCLLFSFSKPSYKLARLKYNGGGDWYGDRTALTNLAKFCNTNLKTNFQADEETVDVGSTEIFNYPFVFMTGHGNVIFTDQEARNLRKYLIGGGFLHICDNYGLDQFIRPQMKKVFPELDFIELPYNHPVYHQKYDFNNGLPKIHEHNNKRPQGFGIIYKGRLVCFYDYECDLGNGWEDYGTYAGDSQQTRLKALQMGANLVQYALIQ
ncbi:DUF4159 domain-containing protein [Mucilaginibacter sp. RS28]|uniref:DUF4159 domain-containing protein n=1 Tax=Mucilaginibacter straminoryzae TaxID=2932774 RepID=A0A9X1X5F2_9SPHI|nr:DUF4159 domain-containing protein [Mucilaginibacter straminoryzae]MCJ8210755.1 DUF4159 domain-containing protein [Mucilaginibacter straminoryzae]